MLFFTGLTTGVAFIDLGPFNTVVALAIATVKMLLVILFFMHVRSSPGLTRVVVAAGFFWLALLIAFTLSDETDPPVEPDPLQLGPGHQSVAAAVNLTVVVSGSFPDRFNKTRSNSSLVWTPL